MCCMRLAGNTGRKNYAKNHHLRTITQICWAIPLQIRHLSTTGTKVHKQQYLLQMSPQYGELRPTNSGDWLANLEHPSKFQRVSHLRFVTAMTSLTGCQPNFAWCLAVSWAGTLYTSLGAFAPWWNFARCKIHFASKSCVLLYWLIGVTAWHSSSGHQPKFEACYKEWNCGTSADGATYIRLGSHHIGHQPIF